MSLSTIVPSSIEPALNHPSTRSALTSDFTRAWLLLPASITGVGIALLIDIYSSTIAAWAGMSAALGFMAWIGSIIFSMLKRRHLVRHPWNDRKCLYYEVPMGTPNGQPTVVLLTNGQPDEVLVVNSVFWRWHELEPCHGSNIWFAGNSDRAGVFSPPGGANLMYARRPLFGRKKLLARVLSWPAPTQEKVGRNTAGL